VLAGERAAVAFADGLDADAHLPQFMDVAAPAGHRVVEGSAAVCLEMARDAKNTEDNPRGSQMIDSMRLRSTGVTVGVGHDPIAPPG
jgi:hypothetical protein